MNSLDINKKVSIIDVNCLHDQIQVETIAKELISELGTSSIEILKQGNQIENIYSRLEQMSIKAEQLFGKSCHLSDLKVQEFIKTQFRSLISSIVETVGNQVPDLIREADLSEAVFSHKGDYHPILVTDSLATCIGVAGYDPINKFGFVVHFTGDDEVEASGAMLVDRLQAIESKTPMLPY